MMKSLLVLTFMNHAVASTKIEEYVRSLRRLGERMIRGLCRTGLDSISPDNNEISIALFKRQL
jgi:hypothetical protein